MKTRSISRLTGCRPARLLVAAAAIRLMLLASGSSAAESSKTLLAVIGDYGSGDGNEAKVAALVASWHPDAVLTVGDNNYPAGSEDSIDAHIGRYYHAFIGNYSGGYGKGAEENRFFPALGNHDWVSAEARPYLDYFDLPGNERYYDVGFGPIRVFVLDSDPHEPDGNTAGSKQAEWFARRLSESEEPWKIVVFHHAPYSSGQHGPSSWMQWPSFRKATAVIAGHDHDYERSMIGGVPFFVDGFGGAKLRRMRKPEAGSQISFASDHGAMRVEATREQIKFEAITVDGRVIDSYALTRAAAGGSR